MSFNGSLARHFIPGFWHAVVPLVRRWHEVPWYQVPWYQVPWYQVRCAKYLVPVALVRGTSLPRRLVPKIPSTLVPSTPLYQVLGTKMVRRGHKWYDNSTKMVRQMTPVMTYEAPIKIHLRLRRWQGQGWRRLAALPPVESRKLLLWRRTNREPISN